MKKAMVCVWMSLLSFLFLIGCGSSANNQNSGQSKETSNSLTKATDNQVKTYNGWITIKVEGEVEFQIPPTLELESEDYKSFYHQMASESYPEVYKSSTKNLIEHIRAHQKGLNEHDPKALEQSAKVSLRIKQTKKEYPKWGEQLSFTETELKKFEESLCNGAKKIPAVKGVTIISHPKIERINDANCIYTKFEYQFENEPSTICEQYMFTNGNRLYTLSTSIRSTEYETWTAEGVDMRNIVKTFTLYRP